MWRHRGHLCRFLLLLFLVKSSTAEEQIKWIPADDDQSQGPLPLSTRQRDELLKLEEAIMSSPDPTATLLKVAESNKMDPKDLAQMLQSNRASYGSLNNGGGRKSIIAVASSKAVAFVKKYPLTTTISLAVLVALYYFLVIELPRTGILISRQRRGIFTRGPTSIFHPSRSYLNQRLESSASLETTITSNTGDATELWDKLEPKLYDVDTDGLTLQRRSKDWKRAMTYQTTISLDEFFGDTAADDEDQENRQDLLEHETDVLLSTPSALSEYAARLTIVSSEDRVVVVVPGMGDWGRYGLLELEVSQQDEDLLVLTTTKGSHWEGQLVVAVDMVEDDLRIRTSIIVTSGRVPRWTMLESMAQSIVKSLRTRCRQDMARRKQSSRFAAISRERAKRRRAERSEKIRQIEAMAEDRRRRWQRNNLNAGHYRPSGDRMKSPNNAVY